MTPHASQPNHSKLRCTTTSYAKATQSTHPQNEISFSIVVQLKISKKNSCKLFEKNYVYLLIIIYAF